MAETAKPTVPRSAMSGECRFDNHDSCKQMQKRCRCSCHGPDGQHPPRTTVPVSKTTAHLRPSSKADEAPPAGATPPGIVWSDPPGRVGRGHQNPVTPAIQAALKARPNTWAKVVTYKAKTAAGSAVARIRRKEILGPGWEATARRNGAGGSDLYLRWVGKP